MKCRSENVWANKWHIVDGIQGLTMDFSEHEVFKFRALSNQENFRASE
jgi:hypothetical protein